MFMWDETVDTPGFIALIDDDQHSAFLLTRVLQAAGAGDVRWYGDAEDGLTMLQNTFATPSLNWPGLVVVDIKSHSGANLEFLTTARPLLRSTSIPVVVMAPPLSEADRRSLHGAGAAAVFIRHADRDEYRREAEGIVGFWAQLRRPIAIGM